MLILAVPFSRFVKPSSARVGSYRFIRPPWLPLRTYAKARGRLAAHSRCDRFFVSDNGRPLAYQTVRTVFRKLCNSQQITGVGPRRPRLHDIRHTFACRCVERWYATGMNLDYAVSALSVYLGHT